MRALVRIFLVALLAVPLASDAGLAQGGAETLAPAVRDGVRQRFRVLMLRDGIVLTPRTGPERSIEIRDGAVAIDGATVSGRELREQLGRDADLIVQLSYASPEALRGAFGTPGAPVPEAPGAPPPAAPPATAPPPQRMPVPDEDADAPPEPVPPPGERRTDREWKRKSGAKVHFGSTVTVDEDERVTDAVVAIGGNVDVRGRVDDDVVAVGGHVRLGPNAVVQGSVTAVGGRVEQEPGAEIRGDVSEIAFDRPFRMAAMSWWPGAGREFLSGWFRLFGTLMRIALVLLLALIVALAVAAPVERIARRAGHEPWLSGIVGLAAQILFVPVLVLTIVVLAVSIIGIPLLLLIPFALVAALFAVLMGFTGVARRVGEWAVGPARSPLVAVSVGVVLISAGAILTRLLWLIPAPIGFVAFALGVIAVLVEYAAWTVGLGAAILTRFGTRGPDVPLAGVPVVPPPIPATPLTAE